MATVVNIFKKNYKVDVAETVKEQLPTAKEISIALKSHSNNPSQTAEGYLLHVERVMWTTPYPMTVAKIAQQDKNLIEKVRVRAFILCNAFE